MRAFQVYILQERLEAKDCELRNLKELLTQKEAAEERDDDDGDKEEANEGNSADVEAWDFGGENFQEFYADVDASDFELFIFPYERLGAVSCSCNHVRLRSW